MMGAGKPPGLRMKNAICERTRGGVGVRFGTLEDMNMAHILRGVALVGVTLEWRAYP